MYRTQELVEIVFDQSKLDPLSLTTLVERVPAEQWSEITGWSLEESDVASRYNVQPEILGAALVNNYEKLVKAQVDPEMYKTKYMEDARLIKAALGSLESVAIAINLTGC